MAMYATADHLSFPIQVAFGFPGELRDFEGCFERCRRALFASEHSFVGRIITMDRQRRFEGTLKTGGRLILRVFLVRPRSVSSVNRAIAVEEHGGKREIVVE